MQENHTTEKYEESRLQNENLNAATNRVTSLNNSNLHKWPKDTVFIVGYIRNWWKARSKLEWHIFWEHHRRTCTINPPLLQKVPVAVILHLGVTNCVNPFVPNAPFLYPLKTSENRKVFWCFQGVDKGCIGNKRVNETTNNDLNEILRLKQFIQKSLPDNKIIILNIIDWITAKQLWQLNDYCSLEIDIVDNNNIGRESLGKKGFYKSKKFW